MTNTIYSTNQSSGDSTINMYWDLVNNRYINIHSKHSYAYDAEWIDGAISDANHGIRVCDLVLKYGANRLVSNYKSSFIFVINQLELLKQGLSK